MPGFAGFYPATRKLAGGEILHCDSTSRLLGVSPTRGVCYGLTPHVALSVRGRDYLYAEKTGLKLSNFKNELRGCGPFLHDDARDRPQPEFAGRTTLHFGPAQPAWLLLPVIPPES